MLTLEINQIQCNAIIGCNAEERTNSQIVKIDLLLDIMEKNYNDDLLQTVNYCEVNEYVKTMVSNTNFHLLETLAKYLAQKLLAKYVLINKVTLNISKPNGYSNLAVKCHYTAQRKFKVALALGSNMHNPRAQLINAIELLTEIIDDMKVASIYKSSPQSFTHQEDFYNTCISGYTTLQPEELLATIKKTEKLLGKQENFVNGPRVIDIDIIFFENLQYKKLFLTIPHPRLIKRDFVLQPLAEINADWLHPEFNQTIKQLLNNLPDDQKFILQKLAD